MNLHDVKKLLYKIKPIAFLLDIRDRKINQRLRKIELKKKEKWDANFLDNNKIQYKISERVNINLYKDSVLSRLIFEGNFELDEINFVKNTLKKGDVFIDIGANIGLFSLIGAEIVGNEGKVICYEPSPNTFNRLKENIVLNQFTNIVHNNIGISDKKSVLKLNISENGHDAWDTFANNVDSTTYQKTADINVNTLDDEISELDIKKIKLIKIDVEGWEKFVLLGAKNVLNNFSPILLVEFTQANTQAAGYNVLEIYDIMTNLGYKWYRYKNNKLVIEKKQKTYLYDNLIAIKDK